MREKKFSYMFIVFGVATMFYFNDIPVMAEDVESVAELRKKIEALEKRVDRLEDEKKNSLHSFNAPSRSGSGSGWNPFEEMNRMQEEMNRMFQHPFDRYGRTQGMINSKMSFDSDFDFRETDNGYEITFDMTGMDKDKIDIQINENSITLNGEQSRQDKEEGPNRYFNSQSYGSFMKTIPLPTNADTSKARTEKKDAQFIITLPKK